MSHMDWSNVTITVTDDHTLTVKFPDSVRSIIGPMIRPDHTIDAEYLAAALNLVTLAKTASHPVAVPPW
jgi:hypothetical protein